MHVPELSRTSNSSVTRVNLHVAGERFENLAFSTNQSIETRTEGSVSPLPPRHEAKMTINNPFFVVL